VTQFEYVSIVLSIIMGLSLARLFEALRDVFDPVRRYWIHAIWVVAKLVNALVLFWSGWRLRDAVEALNFAQFVLLVGPGAILFLQVHALVGPQSSQVPDWRVHYWGIRRWLLGTNALLALYNMLALHAVFGAEFPRPESAMLTGVALLSLVGVANTDERVHGAIAVAYLAILCLGVGGIFAAGA
jgi:hypothetical protein